YYINDALTIYKESDILINILIRQTIIEKDFMEVFKARKIRGAGLDVFETEPIKKDNPLLSMPNVVTLPHIVSSTYQTDLAMSDLAVDNLLEGLNGDKRANLLYTTVWERYY